MARKKESALDEALVEKVEGYESYIRHKGITMEVINAYTMATKTAYATAKTKEKLQYAKTVSKRAKEIIEIYCERNARGTIWELEAFAQRNNKTYDIVESYYEILLQEARAMNFDSYCLYLEKNRPYKQRFYYTRRKCFIKHGFIQGFQDILDDKLDILMISMPPSVGKSLSMTSKVLTPTGFKLMRDIHVGDEVIGGSGEVATVLGVYPQGVLPVYKVTFDDGSSTECSGDHLWTVQTRDDRKRSKERTVTLNDMMKNLYVENGKRRNYSVRYVEPVRFDKKTLRLDPYVMGAFLGNACFTNWTFATADKEVIDIINKRLPKGYSLKFKSKYDYRIIGHEGRGNKMFSLVKKAIQDYGLAEKHSYDKFIPRDYLYSTVNDRWDLLRGLLDTDAYSFERAVEYSTTSQQLAKDVIELVHSLGGYASLSVKTKSGYRDSMGAFVKCRTAYRVVIQFTSKHESPFCLKRKKDNYKPKREKMNRYITSVEYVGDEECQCIYISDPTHLFVTDDYILTHNTTLEKFFHSAICGWYPREANLFYSHSAGITKMYYDGMVDILTNDIDYCWGKIFPDCQVTSMNAALEQVNINAYKPFPNVQTATVGSKMAGKVRCSKLLLVDDVIGGIEEAVNKVQLDKIWNKYTTDARQRRKEDENEIPCKEIHIATRWSVHDVIGRLQRAYKGNDRVRTIAIPDIDPITGESNFLFEFGGFTVKFYDDMRKTMDEVSYRCLYKNDPIEREGILYESDTLMRYHSLPLDAPQAVKAVCDTKTSGIDYTVVPIVQQYDDMYYLVDVVCDNSTNFDLQEEKIVHKIISNEVTKIRFESNQGGSRLAENVKSKLNKSGYNCEVLTAYTSKNKATKIIVHADWIKRHVIFPANELITPKSEMAKFMDFLTTFTITGDNKFDDVPDSMAQLSEMESKQLTKNFAESMINPLWDI